MSHVFSVKQREYNSSKRNVEEKVVCYLPSSTHKPYVTIHRNGEEEIMQVIENPKGLIIRVKLEKDPSGSGARKAVYTPNDIIPMRAGTGKMVHILDQDSPQSIDYKGQQYYYAGNALCGAGRPSKTYPYGSSRNLEGVGGFVDYGSEIKREYRSKGGRPLPITITCYRCIKLHALNKGPVFERDFSPTTQGHTQKHEMLPGGREGFYGEEYENFEPSTQDKAEALRAQVELAAKDSDYWDRQDNLFRVGAPYARTQPETITGYKSAARKFGFEDPEKQVGTTPKTEVIRRKRNPALKVGDRIVEGGRKGTVQSFHSKGTVDVKFDDMDYVIRRQLPMVKRLNPSMHPFLSALHQSDLHLALVGGKLGWRMKFTPSCSVEFTFSEPPQGGHTIVLSTIQVTPDSDCWNKGYGSKAMQKIASIADKTHTEIKLFASPMGTSQLNRKKLKEWYKKFGFKKLENDIMIRYPTTKARQNPSTRAEIQRMIDTAPTSWKTMFKRYKLGSKPSVKKVIATVLEFTPSMNKYGDKGSQGYIPPSKVRQEAMAGLRLSYKHGYTSASGIGLVRAMQLALEPSVWERTVQRMFAYFERHISDTESTSFGDNAYPSNGWMAWLNWGGTAGYEWSASLQGRKRKLMSGERGYDRNDRSKRRNPSKTYDTCKEVHYPSGTWAMLLTLSDKGKPSYMRCCAAPNPVVVMDVHPMPKSSQGMVQYWDPETQKTGFWPCDSLFYSNHTSEVDDLKHHMAQEYTIAKEGFQEMINTFIDEAKEPHLNPSQRIQGILYENYNPFTAQFTAQVQGIYETEVRKALKKKSTAKFKNAKGVRLDAKFSPTRVRSLLSKAFAIATSVGQKQGYLRKGTNKPTAKGIKRAQEREKDKKHLWENILDYETTLYLSRKKKEPRILKKGLRYYIMPTGDYALSLSAAIKRVQDKGGKKKKAVNPRRRRNAKPQKSPLFSEGASKVSNLRVVVTSNDVTANLGKGYENVVIGSYDSFLIAGPVSAFRAAQTYGLKKLKASDTHFVMKQKTQAQDLGRSAEEIALTEMTKNLAATPARINLLKEWGLHGTQIPVLPPPEGEEPKFPTPEVSLKQLMGAVTRGSVKGVNSLAELLNMLDEFVREGVIFYSQYPKNHSRVKARRKTVADLEKSKNKLQKDISKLSGSPKPTDIRKHAALKHALGQLKDSGCAFTEAMIRMKEGSPPIFSYALDSSAIKKAKRLGVLCQDAKAAPIVRRKRGEATRLTSPQQVKLFNPVFTFKIPPQVLELVSTGGKTTLFGQELDVPFVRLKGKERVIYKKTGNEEWYATVLPKDFRMDKRPDVAAVNLGAIYLLAYKKYKADNPNIQNLDKKLKAGRLTIPPKYFSSLTLLMWTNVVNFLFRAKRANYIPELGAIKQQSGVASAVILYAQQRGLPLPESKELSPSTQGKTKRAQKGKEVRTQTPPTTFTRTTRSKKKLTDQPQRTTRLGDKRVAKIVSGGQTGADQGGLEAAVQLGIPTGGWIPKGFKIRTAQRTDSFDPSLKKYGLKETREATYPPRRKKNIEMADATLIYAVNAKSPGTRGTKKDADDRNKPVLIIDPTNHGKAVKATLEFMKKHRPTILNVAGNAEYRSPGIQSKVRGILVAALSGGKRTHFKAVEGDLFDYVGVADAIGITTNLQTNKGGLAIMGAGIAKAADTKYHLRSQYGRLLEAGVKGVTPIKEIRDTTILAVPTKNEWRKKSPPKLVEKSLQELVQLTDSRGWKSVAIPLLGAGLGGLPMTTLKPLLDKYLDDRFTVVVLPAKGKKK